jgi:hypothetical protein
LTSVPNLEQLVLDKANQSSNSMPSCCLMLGLVFVQDHLQNHLQNCLTNLSTAQAGPDGMHPQIALMDKIKLSQQVLASFIKSSILNQLEPSLFINEHLSQINKETDEELFFESFPQENSSSNIHPHVAKRKLVLNPKRHIEREQMVFKAVFQSICGEEIE